MAIKFSKDTQFTVQIEVTKSEAFISLILFYRSKRKSPQSLAILTKALQSGKILSGRHLKLTSEISLQYSMNT